MGFLGDLGMPNIFGGGVQNAGQISLYIFGIFFVLVLSGVITFFYYSKKADKQIFKNKIELFKEINGKRYKIGTDRAKEVYIPDSNVSLYYLKIRKIYIARPTKSMGFDEYWYCIAENGEWVNFDMSILPGQNTSAKINYDHRDTRYAYVNLKEIIKKNYSDKNVKWWKEYAPLISIVIISFITLAGIWFIFLKIGDLVDQIAPLIESANAMVKSSSELMQLQQNLNSGVTISK